MQDTSVFEDFMNTAHGRKVWKAFLKTKKGTEDPVGMIISKIKPRNNTYLEIGGGLGEKTLAVGERFGFKNIDFIEPSLSASRIFSRNAKKLAISTRIFNTPFERFQSDTKYDLITSIHSWYYIGLQELDKLYDILNKDGIACIFLDRKSDIIKKVQDICEGFLGFESNNIEDIIAYVKRKKIKYDLFCEEKTLTGLVKNGRLTEKSKTIISLVAYTEWSKIPENTKEEIRNMLTKSGHDSYKTRRCLIVIRKS